MAENYIIHSKEIFKYDKKDDERSLIWIEYQGDENDRLSFDYYKNSVEFDKDNYTLNYYDENKKNYN